MSKLGNGLDSFAPSELWQKNIDSLDGRVSDVNTKYYPVSIIFRNGGTESYNFSLKVCLWL